jgi:serine/threonine protein kinase
MSTKITHPPTLSKSGARRANALSSEYLLDEYRVETILGAGGFGVTYKALDTHLNAWVAIKEYFPVEWSFRDADGVTVHANTQGLASASGGQTSDYEWGLERFLDEARVLAQIQHPYVVRVKRYFRANGTAYIVMEYEEGEPLSTVLDQHQTLSENEVRGLLEDVLPALQAVHEQGYLHRDIKPANLYLRSRDHRVMLIDFGAARAAIGRHSRNVTSLVTPGYSPPEQYTTRNDRYGTWTDLYALGAVLYRCVTGHTPPEAAERLLDDNLEPAVVAGAGSYSTNLLRVIDRALAVRPEMRFRDVAEMQVALIGARDDDSDETVIMAPVVKTGKRVQDSVSRPVTRPPLTEPVASMDSEWNRPVTVRPLVELPHGESPPVESPQPAIRRREVLPAPAVSAAPPSRRPPLALLGAGVAAMAVIAMAVLWLWPSTPAPEPPTPTILEPGGSLVQSPVDHLPPPLASGTPEAAAPPPPPTPAHGALPVEPTAPVETSTAPAIVETTAREPAPALESVTLPPAGEPPAPLPQPEVQTVQPIEFEEAPATAQPIQFEEEPSAERAPAPVTTETSAPPVPTPAPAPGGVKPRSDVVVDQATSKAGAARKAPARAAEPSRSKTARQKQRRGQTPPPPVVAAPAAPVPSAPAPRISNPWESPTSSGFNQK